MQFISNIPTTAGDEITASVAYSDFSNEASFFVCTSTQCAAIDQTLSGTFTGHQVEWIIERPDVYWLGAFSDVYTRLAPFYSDDVPWLDMSGMGAVEEDATGYPTAFSPGDSTVPHAYDYRYEMHQCDASPLGSGTLLADPGSLNSGPYTGGGTFTDFFTSKGAAEVPGC